MPKRIDAPPLIRCGAIPCPWMTNMEGCAHRIQGKTEADRFRYALCGFYSMPGPHAPSKIAKTLGISVDTVNCRLQSAELKLRAAIRDDPVMVRMLPFDVYDVNAQAAENVA